MKATDLRRIWNDSARLFFAPLVGALAVAVKEFQRVHREVELNRPSSDPPEDRLTPWVPWIHGMTR